MKSITIPLTLLALLSVSAGQPRHQHAHHHKANRDFIPKGGKITITGTAYSTTTEIPEVVVYVDQNNKPIHTTTETVVYIPAPASTETRKLPAPSTSTVIAPPAPTKAMSSGAYTPPASSTSASSTSASSTSKHISTFEPIPSPRSSRATPTPSVSFVPSSVPSSVPSFPPPPPISSGSALHGVTYSPYKGSGGCKSASEVDADFALIAKDYGVMRLYGVDCNQIATAYAAAKKYGNKLFLGIYDINSVEQSVSAMAAGVKHDWSIVDTVSVGNELVNNGGATVDQSLGALSQARSALRAAGYQGPVVVVDTFVAMLSHPELCDQSDYCAVNVHPFFDPNTGPHQAGSFITSTVSKIRSKLSDSSKRIVVTETGWPWQGEANGAAVPGMGQQSTALSSIKNAYSDNARDLILFTAFNDMWKRPESGTFMAEQFWGMGGRYSPSDV
ncbi:glycoside hydrolase family 17 protein [Annulohypoxylon maeteangense]|uniref:glycoside hydrolase family 17 protein n=1 Tax=Annulohypoxylon maeteangense TaxID=1927788 RepID=UPI00200876E2|nr:glycoside hydrolase family 17 protein [Annulohypoxylon maeteangense]KAI0879827.1 glycoside hydrolase family 17 protein [Annulohypoxylon maeteangense]